MSYSIDQLRDLSSLFLRGEVSLWRKNNFKNIDLKLQRYDLYEKYRGLSYLSCLKKIYKTLVVQYPNEYVIKNELLSTWLRDELGNNDSIIFNEFRLGDTIADFAMFNGKSKVFEIKTILDNEYRLSGQLRDYKKIFNEIYLVVPKEHIAKYSEFDNSVGIISYDVKNGFELCRDSEFNTCIEINILMKVLHTHEYLMIVQKYFGFLPNMTAFNQFNICQKLIAEIPQKELNRLFIATMKKRNINSSFLNQYHKEFAQVCLSQNLKQDERVKLLQVLKENIIN
ncbi:sce7726 family protein [Wohlfahrtiimonas chitiniclastica]|uniref:sce7726 family protein n=1 Tax=Wohlfahrtiimonas chitiniclastica TaxID=400946 RepID=UPI000B99AD15|nr:sce7726 family protein [Wohlfahrtiimonas chitiniclastica]MBS7815941.1 sce7726 family protein [Wohlfahrtiimonas chitiniclastica]MBS7822064.1 sce7726 family protein [Wohlfahrtiimonas chitiniclastica]MBS7829856.1 sce7726 family protein [Wohlfahrtiimonas chitiniclastica]MBS7831823.1 sce7726 family protein [Wohlfahrtiimonas chitiniclastica]OYQ69094.1 hypothetical protein B9T13_09845 [Wohlfahrtiimonas chitiniclastica]